VLSFTEATAEPAAVDGGPFLVVDTGGGSTEFVLGEPAERYLAFRRLPANPPNTSPDASSLVRFLRVGGARYAEIGDVGLVPFDRTWSFGTSKG
jgi:hypothetical protein